MVRRIIGRHDLSTVEARSAAVADALPILERLNDPVRRSEYAHLLSDLAGVSESSVMESLDRKLGGRPQEVAKTLKRTSAREKVEREMLKILARDPESFGTYDGLLSEDHFRSSANRSALAALRSVNGNLELLTGGEDPQVAASMSMLAVEPLDGDPTPEYAYDVWARLQEFLLKGRSEILRMELQKLNPTTDDTYDDRFRELVETDGELRRLREKERDG
jgi:DNA primase